MIREGPSASPALKLAVDAVRESIPDILHPCPYVGMQALAMKLDKRALVLLPAGLYKFESRLTNQNDDKVLFMSLIFEIN